MRKRDIEPAPTTDSSDPRSIDDFDDETAEPALVPMRPRGGSRPEPGRRGKGRLTEETRARLLQARETTAVEDGPPSGDRWTSWADAEEHGPQPGPGWLVTDPHAVDSEMGVLKTGKEADVFLVERTLPATGQTCLMAAKRYRGGDHRLFHRDAGYLEGRRVRASREMRAMERRSGFGRNLIAQRWAVAEFAALRSLWSVGAPVPYPVQRIGTELLMEFIGDDDGAAAPRLVQLRPDQALLADLWHQLIEMLVTLAKGGQTHGDLSAYNLLVHRGELLMIDLPQLVDVVTNPRGLDYLRRDVSAVATWFVSRGLPGDVADPQTVVDLLLREAGLR